MTQQIKNRGARGDSSLILAGMLALNEKPPLQADRLSGGSRSLNETEENKC
jgi:hypothetical protein